MSLQTDNAELRAEIRRLRAGYAECIEDMIDWAAYAGDYFGERWGLDADVKKHRDELKEGK